MCWDWGKVAMFLGYDSDFCMGLCILKKTVRLAVCVSGV